MAVAVPARTGLVKGKRRRRPLRITAKAIRRREDEGAHLSYARVLKKQPRTAKRPALSYGLIASRNNEFMSS
jgi:hypothetical protein